MSKHQWGGVKYLILSVITGISTYQLWNIEMPSMLFTVLFCFTASATMLFGLVGLTFLTLKD